MFRAKVKVARLSDDPWVAMIPIPPLGAKKKLVGKRTSRLFPSAVSFLQRVQVPMKNETSRRVRPPDAPDFHPGAPESLKLPISTAWGSQHHVTTVRVCV